LSFRSSGHSKFAEFLGKALEKAAWAEEERRLQAAAASQVDAPLIAGVAGLMKRAEEGRSKQLATQTEAFSDLDALMGRAGEMAKLAETIARKLSAHEATVTDAQDRDFQRLLLDLGLTGTASANREGALHATELARQLSVFLGKLFDLRQVQMMPLSDIYCIYNRARGNDLVSPQDLFRAASQFDGLGLPMRLRTMSSGLLVVQSAAFSEEQVVKRLFDSFFSLAVSVSPFDMATREGISTQLATELLLECERHGRVCRDLSPSGIQFYPNRFLTDFA
jgi:ESCRT-II complex subunit VPS36